MGKSRTSPLTRTGTGGFGVGGVAGVVASTNANQTQVQSQNQTNADDLIDGSKIDSIYGNNTSQMFLNMTDDEMESAVLNSINVDMPNHIGDIDNNTQKFTYENGLNSKPTVLSDTDFDNYLKNNKISDDEILIREVNPVSFNSNNVQYTLTANDITDMFKTSDINYIGGKRGGNVYGDGTYFAQEGRYGSSGYGSGNFATMMAVFDKSKARVISKQNINSEWISFAIKNPKTAKAVDSLNYRGDVKTMKALLMGYNVITSSNRNTLTGKREYYNIIDRSALVVRANNR